MWHILSIAFSGSVWCDMFGMKPCRSPYPGITVTAACHFVVSSLQCLEPSWGLDACSVLNLQDNRHDNAKENSIAQSCFKIHSILVLDPWGLVLGPQVYSSSQMPHHPCYKYEYILFLLWNTVSQEDHIHPLEDPPYFNAFGIV